MARRRRSNNRGRINLTKKQANNRRTSNPQNEREELEAIQQDLDSEVMAMVRQIYLEKGLDRKNIEKVFGIGGPNDDLQFFKGSFEEGFADVRNEPTEYPYGFEKEEAPEIKRTVTLVNQEGTGEDDIENTQLENRTQTNRRTR